MERCENCGCMIGNMETPRVFDDRVVCHICHARLSGQIDRPACPAPPVKVADRNPPAVVYVQQPVYVPHPAQVVVPPTTTRTSALGVVSLVLGVIALLVAWIPLCGVVGWPFAIVGLICGVIGFILAICSDDVRASTPFFGSAFCVVAIVLPFVLPAAAVIGGASERLKEIERQSTTQPATKPASRVHK